LEIPGEGGFVVLKGMLGVCNNPLTENPSNWREARRLITERLLVPIPFFEPHSFGSKHGSKIS